MPARDPAQLILEELELGDERMAVARQKLLECVASSVEILLAEAADALGQTSKEAAIAALNSIELGDLPDLEACLEEIVEDAAQAGQERGEELAADLGPLPDTFAEFGTPRSAGIEAAERVAQLASSWRDVLRQSILDRYIPMLRGVVESDHAQAAVSELAPVIRGITIQIGDIPAISREAAAGAAAVEASLPAGAARVLPAVSRGKEALEEWLRGEVKRQGEALRNTSVEQAVIGTDVEANELGKLEVAEADPRVRVIRYHAILDERTTCLCGGLDGFTMAVGDKRRIRYMPPLHINCRSTISFEDVPEGSANFDEVRSVTVNDRPTGSTVVRTSYSVAPANILPSALGGTSPPPKVLADVIR